MTTAATYTGFRREDSPTPTYLLKVGSLVFASAILCLALTWSGGQIAGIWLGNAFILAPLLQHRRRDWAALLAVGYVANFCADVLIGDPLSRSAIMPLLNMLEVLMIALPMRYFELDRDFTRTQSLIPFYILAGGPAPFVVGALAACYFHAIEHSNFWASVWIWYGGDALGHGLGQSVGMALGLRLQGRDARVFNLLSDGECQEGSTWEAALAGAHHRLDRLIAIIDCNNQQADGSPARIMGIEPLHEKWSAFGWHTQRVNGHDIPALLAAFAAARATAGQPHAIVIDTLMGKGVRTFEEREKNHFIRVAPEEWAVARSQLEASS